MLNEEPEAAGDWQKRMDNTTENTFQAGVRRVQGALAERYRAWSQEMARVQARLMVSLRRFGAKFVQTAELVGWAPTAVVCAILAAGLAGVTVTWLTFTFRWDYSTGPVGIVAVTSSLSAAVILRRSYSTFCFHKFVTHTDIPIPTSSKPYPYASKANRTSATTEDDP